MKALIASALALCLTAPALAADFDWSVAGVYTDTSLDACSGDCVGILDDKESPVGLAARAHFGPEIFNVGAMVSFSNGPGAFLSLRSVVAGLDISAGAGKQFFDTQVGLPGTLGTRTVDSDLYADAYFARVGMGPLFVQYVAYDDTHSVSQRDVTGYDVNNNPIYGGTLAADYAIDRSEIWLGYTAGF